VAGSYKVGVALSGDKYWDRVFKELPKRVARKVLSQAVRAGAKIVHVVAGQLNGAAIRELRATRPDLVLTHYRNDRHQDHRLVSELTWNTFRDHLILEYEIAKYEGDLGHPNVFVPLTDALARRKVELLMRHFPSQSSRSWFRAVTFEALMRLRAVECNAPDGFAEGLYGRKIRL